MTTINQINNLILSGHNQQGLSVCQDHEKAILEPNLSFFIN